MSHRPSIGIIGLGLIGGSAAKAFAQAGLSVYGYDLDVMTIKRAYAESVVVNAGADWREWAEGVDWVLMAPPLAQVNSWLTQWTSHVQRAQLIIDVSSVKKGVLPTLSALPPRFTPICLHPMAGSELTGYPASTPDLFRGHVCAVVSVPNRESAPEPVIAEILQWLGMHAYPIAGLAHDQVAALVSHLPYLVSAALLVTAERVGPPLADWPQMAGPGFLDTSRVGSSSPMLWNEILSENREAVLRVLEVYSEVVSAWVGDLKRARPPEGLKRAQAIRSRVEEGKPWN